MSSLAMLFGWPERDQSELAGVQERWVPREHVADQLLLGAYSVVGALFVLDLGGVIGSEGSATFSAAALAVAVLAWSTLRGLGALARFDAGARTVATWRDATPFGTTPVSIVIASLLGTFAGQVTLALLTQGNLGAAPVWPLAAAATLIFATVAGALLAIVVQLAATLAVLFRRPDDRPTALAITGVSALVVAIVVRRAVPDTDLAYRLFGLVFVASVAALLAGLTWGQVRLFLQGRRR